MDHSREVLLAGTLTTFKVQNSVGESVGKIEDVIIDLASGRVACAVLSIGTMGMEEKLFAIPWAEFNPDPERDKIFILDIPKGNSYPSLETSTLKGGEMGSPSLSRCNRSNSAIAYRVGGR